MGQRMEDILSGLYNDLWENQKKISDAVRADLDAGKSTDPKTSEINPDNMNVGDILKMHADIRSEVERDFGIRLDESGNEIPGGTKTDEGQGETQPEAMKQADPGEPETDPMEELDGLIGLKDLKADVKELINLVKMQKLRQEKGLKTVPVSLHLVFTGNPGTGKTTIARILAKLYKQIGVISQGQLVEVDRSALVAGYVGQTAIKTQEKIKEAMGGILFIDEAYTLASGNGNDFGQEAIDTILKAMEDHRKDFVVIVAGYPDLMEKFINSNPGLKSRFNKYIYFPDYSAEELMQIFEGLCKKYDYIVSEEAHGIILDQITKMEAEKGENFANARSVRNLFENIITNQASRVAAIENPGEEQLLSILPDDIDSEDKEKEE